jgi:hypothetical protein
MPEQLPLSSGKAKPRSKNAKRENDPDILFLESEIARARRNMIVRESCSVIGCNCRKCLAIRDSNGPKCGSQEWSSIR